MYIIIHMYAKKYSVLLVVPSAPRGHHMYMTLLHIYFVHIFGGDKCCANIILRVTLAVVHLSATLFCSLRWLFLLDSPCNKLRRRRKVVDSDFPCNNRNSNHCNKKHRGTNNTPSPPLLFYLWLPAAAVVPATYHYFCFASFLNST